MRARLVATAVASLTAVASAAQAEPQANLAATAGVTGVGVQGAWWAETRFHLGARGDVLFGRARNLDWGYGPYGEAMTSFDDVSVGGGGSVLAPIHPYLPIVMSGGGYERRANGAWEPGVTGQLFWGSRSFNYGSWYVMAGGLSVQMRYGLGSARERSVVLAAHIDGEVLMLPFLFLVEAFRGSPSE